MRTLLTFAALLLAAPLYAQYPGVIYTPEIHVGSLTTPSTITVPPIEYVPGIPEQTPESNVPPADTALLAQRHFDFITSPASGMEFAPQGSLADTSISLGDYAREVRAQKGTSAPSRVITIPENETR